MPHDRSLLLMSMALQGAVSLTFGLAFLGLWKGFNRPIAMWWATAWIVYGVGILFAGLGIGFQFGANSPPVIQSLLNLPLQFGVVLFRAGTDALTEPGGTKPRRYLWAGLTIFAIILVVREVQASDLVRVHPAVAPFILPRTLLGLSFAWVAWPLRTMRRRWAEGFSLMAGALMGLSLRMFGSVGYEVSQIVGGAADRPESPLLTVAQVCLLIAFGVATAFVLVDAERLTAVRAAQTIRETADALRASEARFRFVVEHTSDVQVIVGVDDRIRYVAPSCERVIGLPPSAFEGRHLMDVIHPDDRTTVRNALARMQADPSGRRPPTAVRLQHSSGEWLPVDVSGQLVPRDNAAGATMVLSIRDMGAQRQLEAALLQSRKLDNLGRVAGTIAHDFNNILTTIEGGVTLALEDLPVDGPVARDLKDVRTAAHSGAALTRQILTFARKLPAASERFDVRDRLASLEGVVRMAVGRTVHVCILRSDQALLVRADPGQFDQVIMNLAINARDAMPSGGQLTIQSRIVTVDEAGQSAESHSVAQYARISVEDTGVSIPAGIVDRIFEPFFTTKDGRGTGLGLASADVFARGSGGRMSVESTEGVGTRFSMDLPLAADTT